LGAVYSDKHLDVLPSFAPGDRRFSAGQDRLKEILNLQLVIVHHHVDCLLHPDHRHTEGPLADDSRPAAGTLLRAFGKTWKTKDQPGLPDGSSRSGTAHLR
jgi:hypothetical protein